jgi:trk system potassium uptake protein TrkH
VNYGRIARVLAGFVAFFTASQIAPLCLAATEEAGTFAGFVASIVIGAVTAILLWAGGRDASGHFFRKDTLCVGGVAWVLAGLLAAIPLQWSGLLPDPVDAVFESVSGLTTCGATVLGTAGNPAPEATPESLLLWRAMLQWLGGIGIVLLFVALLPSKGIARKNLLMAESVGFSQQGYQPHMLDQARGVVGVYVGLTVACAGCLALLGGMRFFDAICHSFAAVATGGFATRTSIAAFDSLSVEVILTVFMFLSGCSFTVMAASVRDGFSGLRSMARTSAVRIYTVMTLLAVSAVTIDLMRGGLSFGPALRLASFNVVSMLSCCGFATGDFHAWPPLSLLVILVCTMVGGCSGSAAGGMKQVRLLICLKLLTYTLRQFLRPRSVERLRLDGEVLPASTISQVLAMALFWLLAILVGAFVIALDQRLSLLGALSTSASMLGNCGPGMAAVHPDALAAGVPAVGQAAAVVGPNVGPFGGFGELGSATKLAMSFEMVLGRLELLPLLVLLQPSFWRR